ncbi:hypothetical protein TNCT_657651 [Trichonephila clavata]|uniref:Uncharacterized protein n=1 Tax=Trichonephila clavata TaxID=2740835 RepID=A0A8X6LXM5_TRICU|nr:hypothetical protein TNCT_657651 [Trichonephila clavata]
MVSCLIYLTLKNAIWSRDRCVEWSSEELRMSLETNSSTLFLNHVRVDCLGRRRFSLISRKTPSIRPYTWLGYVIKRVVCLSFSFEEFPGGFIWHIKKNVEIRNLMGALVELEVIRIDSEKYEENKKKI